MGTIKTTNIETITGSGTLTLGQSGETIDIPSGVTFDSTGATVTGALTNTPAFLAILSGDQSISTSTLTALQFNTEVFDTNNCFNTSTYKFTPTTSGKYFVYVKGRFNNDVDYDNSRFVISKNGSQYAECRNTNRYYDSFYLSLIMEFNGSTDYINAQAEQGSGVSQSVEGTSTHQGRAEFGAYKLIGV